MAATPREGVTKEKGWGCQNPRAGRGGGFSGPGVLTSGERALPGWCPI